MSALDSQYNKGEAIVGIVTETDIVSKVVVGDQTAYSVSVEEFMSAPVLGIDEQRPITEAAELMEAHRARHLAVRDLLRPVSMDAF